MKSFLTLIFLIILQTGVSDLLKSQSKIEGMVYSENTGEPLSGVSLFTDDNNKTPIGKTDENGKFVLENIKKSTVSIKFKRVGYSQKIVELSGSIKINKVYLAEELPESEEIIVNDNLYDNNLALNNFYMTSDLNSIDELISKTPGMTVIKRGNYASEPVIRGMNSDRINVTIDGMKIQSACTDKMDPVTSYAETNNLKSISVSKGAFSKDDCASTCSSIDMKLKDAETENKLTLNGNINGGYLSVSNGAKVDGSFNLKSRSFGNNLSLSYRTSGDYKDGSGNEVFHSGYNKVNLTNSSLFRADDKNSFKAIVIYDYAWDIGYPALTMDVKDAEAFITGIQFNSKDISKLIKDLEAKVYFNKINHVMDDSQRDNRIKMDMPGWTDTKGAYIDSRLNAGNMNFGVKAEFSELNANAEMTMYPPGASPMYMVTWPDVNKDELSLSINTGRMIGSNLRVDLGVRAFGINSKVNSEIGYSELKIFYPEFSGEDSRFLGNVYMNVGTGLWNSMTAGINYSYSKRNLTISEQYAFYIFNRLDSYDYIGNPYLKNESSNQLELNLNYDADNFRLENSLFGYFFGDYIVGKVDSALSPMTENSNGVKIYTNIPSAVIMGFEQTADIKISEKIRLINNIQYTYGRENNDKYLPQMPPLMGTLSGRYTADKYLLQGEAVWAASQNKINADYGETGTPSFLVFNLRSSINLFDLFTLDAGIENIFDVNYYEHLDWQKIPRPGRNLYIAINTEF
ncbi:MAG: hypothetical protein HGGPFJEG_00116 [Ignavibacteria bacterium]|nr:hypothetical protein [Ignavibacteria bacterium]